MIEKHPDKPLKVQPNNNLLLLKLIGMCYIDKNISLSEYSIVTIKLCQPINEQLMDADTRLRLKKK